MRFINKIKCSNLILVFAILALTLGLGSCQNVFEFDRPLGITAENLSLKNLSGSTHIIVYSNGAWTAELEGDSSWSSINKLSGEGTADIVFSYSANYGVARKVDLVLRSGEDEKRITLKQAAGNGSPSLNLEYSEITALGAKSTCQVPLNTNLKYDLVAVETEVAYGDEEDEEDEEETVKSDIDWIKNVEFTDESLTFDVDEFSGSEPRKARVILSLIDANDSKFTTSVIVNQNSDLPIMTLVPQNPGEEIYSGISDEYLVAFSEFNLLAYSNDIEINISYEDGADWIEDALLSPEGLGFRLKVNEEGIRSAVITLSFTDSEGNEVKTTHNITQKVYPRLIDLATLRGKLSEDSGEIVLDTEEAVELVVISEPASKNIIQSPQTGRTSFNYDENFKNAYTQSVDGKYGLRLRFNSKEDASAMLRYCKIRISLKGLTLEKDANPARYSITGITAENIVEASIPDIANLTIKEKAYTEINDDDLYTLVTIPEAEIVYKYGAFTNTHDGYTHITPTNPFGNSLSRWDCAPRMLTTPTGDSFFMLFNSSVEWRRDGKGVPQGAGPISGVVVSEDLPRYGDIGEYQLRPMVREDIVLGSIPFSKTIAEWNWDDTQRDEKVDLGAGTLILQEGTTLSATLEYNSLTGTQASKGGWNSAIYLKSKYWWNYDTDEGGYFDIKFSTAGMSGSNMTFGVTANHGYGGNTSLDNPVHWKVLYSTDNGASFTEIPNYIIQPQPIVWWTNTGIDCTPGCKEFLVKLPTECLGKDNVLVRMQVADKTCDITPSAGDWLARCSGLGVMTYADKERFIRIGAITVRYN